MKTAVIDVGSNSVRYAVLTPDTTIAKKQLITTVLADGLFFSGSLNREAISRTVAAVEKFCTQAKEDGADEILIFATEAVRAAKNGNEFVAAVYSAVGLRVEVIDGVTEAQIGFTGALSSASGSVAVFDLGGASCEIICGLDGRITSQKSYPIGCVRLRDGANKNREITAALLARALPEKMETVDKVIGIGGTATALGAMVSCPKGYDPRAVHDSTVKKEFLLQTADSFFGGENLMKQFPCLTPNRAEIIGYGALACLQILNALGKSEFTVSERDNIEGYYQYKNCK